MSGFLTFPPLERLDWLVHGFTLRQEPSGAGASRDKLQPHHLETLRSLGIAKDQLRLAGQIHGAEVVAVEEGPLPAVPASGADGLVTRAPGLALGIHVADCGAVYLVETRRRAIGLLHSGRRGTEANIVRHGARRLVEISGGDPADMVAVLGPCIHACCYDTDFAAMILEQLAAEGIREVWQHPDCTACHPNRYDSYRRDKGDTGRMLAFLMIRY